MENKFSKLKIITQSSKIPFALFSLVLIGSFIIPNTTKVFGFTLPTYITNIPGAKEYVTNLINTPGSIENIRKTAEDINNSAKQYLELGKGIVNNPLISRTVEAIDPTAVDKINGLSSSLDANSKKLVDAQSKIKKLDAAIAYCGGADNLNTSCAAKAINDVMGAIGDIKALTGSGDVSQKIQAAQNLFSRLSALNPDLKGVSDMLGTAGSLFSGTGSIADKAMGFAQSAMTSTNGANLLGAGGSLGDLTKNVKEDITKNITDTPAGKDFFANKDMNLSEKTTQTSVGTVCSGEEMAGVGSNGVPTVEQDGALLTLTKKNTYLSKQNCQYLKITSEMVTDIDKLQNKMWTKLEKEDPDKWTESREATKDAAKKFDDNLKKEWRSTSVDYKPTGKESAAPTIEKYTREQEAAARIKGLSYTTDLVESISNPYTKQIYQSSLDLLKQRNDTLSDETGRSAFIAQNTPDETIIPLNQLGTIKDSSYFTQLTKHMDPVNNPIGVMMNLMTQTAVMETKAADDAQKELMMGQGILSKKDCIGSVTYEGNTTCLEYMITQPAKFVADLGSFFVSAGAKMTAESKLSGEKSDKAAKESVSKAIMQSDDSSETDPLANAVAVEDISSLDELKKIVKDICAIPGLSEKCAELEEKVNSTLSGSGGMTGSDTGGFTGGENAGEGTIANKILPDPTITFTQKTIDPGTGIKQAILTWSSENTTSCIAGNDWKTFGNENTPSIESEFIFKNGEDIDWTGETKITFPALFDYTVSTSGGIDPNTITLDVPPYSPQSITSKFTVDSSGNMIQTATYKPNTTNLKGWDYINFFLGGVPLTLLAGTDEDINIVSVKDIVDRTKQSIIDKDGNLPKFTMSTTENSLILSLKADKGTFTRSANYSITCYNEEGREVSKSINIDFFK